MILNQLILSAFISTGVVMATDCDVVQSAYAAMGGSYNWPNGCCAKNEDKEINGVRCYDSSVVSITWSSKGLNKKIATSLTKLKQLEYLDLSYNSLKGTIPPELGNFENLGQIYLTYNKLTGPIPPELGNLTTLTGLYLDHNQLSEEIPTELSKLKQLTDLDLSSNQLTGPIPRALKNMPKLQVLYLTYNQLTGSIPQGLGDLKDLIALSFYSNQLTGPIPTDLTKLKRLQQLSFAYNSGLRGGFGWFPSSAFDPDQLIKLRTQPTRYLKRQVITSNGNQLLQQYNCTLNDLDPTTYKGIVAGCTAGLQLYCLDNSTTITRCQLAWNSVYTGTYYEFIAKSCFPWNSASGCQQAYNKFLSGISDSRVKGLRGEFSKLVINSFLSDSKLAPCSNNCIRAKVE